MSPRPIDRLKPSKRRAGRAGAVQAGGPQAPAAVVAGPVTAELESRRERLARDFAALQSDLGGLVYEMAIRDSYRLDVITRQAAKLQALDAELTRVETMLAPPVAPPAPVPPPAPLAVAAPAAGVCPACASPAQPGATFCGRCGTPLARSFAPPTPPVSEARP